MTVRNNYWLAALASGVALAALGGCSPSAPEEQAPPPPAVPHAPPPPLAGGPPVEMRGHDLPPVVVSMAPIPNPEDLAPGDRRRIYGPGRYTTHGGEARGYDRAPSYGPVAHVVHHAGPVRIAPVARTVVSHPIAAPKSVKLAPAPVVVAPKPVPVVAPVAPPSKPLPKLTQLQNAVGQSVVQGSSLSVSPEVTQGKPGGVSLSLPANLLDMIRDQAAKFGFKKAARKADVSATLSGQGYAITPNGKQTAALKAGEATKFSWQVTPGQDASGPLKAQVDASLKGQGEPKMLSLATLQSAVIAAPAVVEKAASGLHLPNLHFPDFGALFGAKPAAPASTADATPAAAAAAPEAASTSPLHDRTLPIVGHVTVRAQVAAFLAFLAVLILLLIQRNMAEQRKAAQRRRFRTYQPTDMGDETPAPSAH